MVPMDMTLIDVRGGARSVFDRHASFPYISDNYVCITYA